MTQLFFFFFLKKKDISSAKIVFSLSKYQIAGIGVLKNLNVAICGIKCYQSVAYKKTDFRRDDYYF